MSVYIYFVRVCVGVGVFPARKRIGIRMQFGCFLRRWKCGVRCVCVLGCVCVCVRMRDRVRTRALDKRVR